MTWMRGIELDLQLCKMILIIHKVSFSIRASCHASHTPSKRGSVQTNSWRYARAQFGFGAELGLFPRPLFPVPIVKSLYLLVEERRQQEPPRLPAANRRAGFLLV